MDKSMSLYTQLVILGSLIYLTTAVSLRHKRNVIGEYKWPEPDPKIDQFPHETTCHYYYLVLSAEDITINKCPDGELFDYVDHKCARKETARCWSRHFGRPKHHHIPLKSRGQFRCPYAWGKYPDINDCSRYFVCLSGKVKHRKCAPFEHFDKVSRKCVAAITGVCADKTDVVERDYKCPRTWGSFSFSKDCSKYYECLGKKPNLRTCPTDTLFHERREKCLPQNHVHCGSRHNPYGKKEEKPITDESTLFENPSATSNEPIKYTQEKETVPDIKISSETKPDVEGIPTEADGKKNSESKGETIAEKLSSISEVPSGETSSSALYLSSEKPGTSNEPIKYSQENETVPDLKISSEAKPDVEGIPTEADIKISSKSKVETIVEKLPLSSEVPSGETVSSDLHLSSSTPKKEAEDLSTESSVPNETKSVVEHNPLKNINPGNDPVNATDEILDEALNTNEFVEVSTTASETSSPTASKTTSGDSSQKVKSGVTDIKDQHTSTESPQSTIPDECSPKDPTCITEEGGSIIRCPAADGIYPYPGDERRFLMCNQSEIRVKYCPGDTIFSYKAKKCIGRLIFS